MTPKQRVHAALRRQKTDRVPIFMWFHPDTAARLARLLEIRPDQVGLAMGNDMRQAWVNNRSNSKTAEEEALVSLCLTRAFAWRRGGSNP